MKGGDRGVLGVVRRVRKELDAPPARNEPCEVVPRWSRFSRKEVCGDAGGGGGGCGAVLCRSMRPTEKVDDLRGSRLSVWIRWWWGW